jgi:cyanophycinase
MAVKTLMKKLHDPWAWLAIAFLVSLAPSQAQTPRINPAGIQGALLLCGGGDVSDAALERFIDLAGGVKARIAVVDVNDKEAAALLEKRLSALAKKKEADEPKLLTLKDAKAAIPDLTGIWLISHQRRGIWQESLKQNSLRAECLALLKRSGVVATSGFTSAIVGDEGLALLPLDVFDARPSNPYKKKRNIAGPVAFEVKPGAALLIKGRTLSAVGNGSTLIYLSASKALPPRTITLQGKAQEDLTALRRAAADRQQSFPPKAVEAPVVANGTLVIVGGGGSPAGLYDKFVDYAGGKGKANIVIFPTAHPDPLPKRDAVAAAFKKAGARKATVLYGKTLVEVESKEFLDALKEATGLWFDGGRQWRFVDCYENTKALPLMFDVLSRGGVIGGTSAGATIQGDYLCRGGVFHNFDIRYEGYERGLGFLKGVAIDQHFSQRKRQAEMTSLMKTYPQYLGIGLDEATAIVVKRSVAEVIGKGRVHFYDAARKVEKDQPDYEALAAGGRYDLKERKTLSMEK